MNSRVFTVVLIVVFSCFAFAADKPSKTVILKPGNNNVSQVGDEDFMAIPYFSNTFSNPSPLYKVPANLQWLDHTDGELNWQLIGLQEGDTLAVWYKGAGACSLYSIQSQWGSGDDVSTVLFYIWEDAGHPQVGDPGLSFNRNDWEGGSPLGDVVRGPIPFTPAPGSDWQEIVLRDLLIEPPFFGDTEGNPQSFFVGYVLQGEFPEILADNIDAGVNYSWLGGPSVFDADRGIVEWGRFADVIEYMFRIGVTYPYGAKPTIGLINALPETYEGDQLFTVSTTITDESAVNGAWVHWNINDPVPGADSAAMTASDDLYTGMFNPGAALGDTVYYWVSAVDDDGNKSMENLIVPNSFMIIAPENPEADLLFVDDGVARDPEFITDILASLEISYEYWNVADMRGIDASVTTYGWPSVVVASWGTSVIPTRSYDANDPFAAFLDGGGNLFFTDQDYFFSNNEVAEPTFVSGDFAYDYFGISGGTNDPDTEEGAGWNEWTDTLVIGAEGDAITDFMSGELVPMRPDDWAAWDDALAPNRDNWTDYVIAGDADPIVTTNNSEDTGVKYDNGTFKTVFLAFMVEAMNDTTGWIPDSAETRTYSNDYVTLMTNAFSWLEFVSAIDDEVGSVPLTFSLEQNYPNPFNPSTDITFRLGKAVDVDLIVYSITGQKVRTLVKGYQKAGTHTISWNGMNDIGNKVASGVYFYSIEAGDFQAIKKMVLIK